jgi:hypothetical protein
MCVDISLEAFREWCEFNHKGYDWTDIFDILKKADIGLDSFNEPKTKASKILQLCESVNPKLKLAAAECLVKAHARWVKKGKPAAE